MDYYKETSTNLLNFERSSFYMSFRNKQSNRLSWFKLAIFSNEWGNIWPIEVAFISVIVKEVRPKAIFEFGTYNGYSTVHLAANAPEDCMVYTIDLPQEAFNKNINKLSLIQAYDDIKTVSFASKLGIGSIFIQNEDYKNITQLRGDTLTYDFSQYYGKIDLCFIDACHSYNYVKSDSENAFKMITGKGIIIWHDFDPNHYDVFRYLNEVARRYKIYYVPDTRLAVYFSDE